MERKCRISNFTILQSRIWFNFDSPFLLNGTISAHREQFNGYVNFSEFICKFIRDLYVDDSSSSFDDIEDVDSFYKTANSNLNLARFDFASGKQIILN